MDDTVTDAARQWLACKAELGELSKRRATLNKQKKQCEEVLARHLEGLESSIFEIEGHKLTLKVAVVEE